MWSTSLILLKIKNLMERMYDTIIQFFAIVEDCDCALSLILVVLSYLTFIFIIMSYVGWIVEKKDNKRRDKSSFRSTATPKQLFWGVRISTVFGHVGILSNQTRYNKAGYKLYFGNVPSG